MQTYDTVLKSLLTSSDAFIHRLTQVTVKKWLNVELPRVQNRRVDLLCEVVEGNLLHIELQSSNDSLMNLRMAEYALQIYRLYAQFPRQLVLYTGNAPSLMKSGFVEPSFSTRYAVVDIRDLDGEKLLASAALEENILSVLTRLRDQRAAVRQILSHIATLETGQRETAFQQLGLLAGLREIGHIVKEESAAMPITASLLDHDLLGPVLKQGIRQGMEQGIEQGAHQGAEAVLRRLMQKRFGPLPEWANTRLSEFTTPELEDLSLRLLDVQTLDELFAR